MSERLVEIGGRREGRAWKASVDDCVRVFGHAPPIRPSDVAGIISREERNLLMRGMIAREVVLDQATWEEIKDGLKKEQPSFPAELISPRIMGCDVLLYLGPFRRCEVRG